MLLITGGSGYIGQKLIEQLKQNSSQKILILTRHLPRQKDNSQLQYIQGDLLDSASLSGKFAEVTKVLHLASLTHSRDEKEYFRVNTQGTKNLLDALPSKLRLFVYASTVCAEPGSGGYGESKLMAEKMITAAYPAQAVMLRIADVFGGLGEKSLEKLITTCRSTSLFPLIGMGNQIMAPVHVDDLIEVLIDSLSLTQSQTLVVAGSEKVTFRVLIQGIYHQLKKPFIFVPIPIFIYDYLVRVLSWFAVGPVYPDQVKRFVVHKNLDASTTWRQFNVQPKLWSTWLKEHI
jgi:nucleoside-diphosphate-sugar epimerase